MSVRFLAGISGALLVVGAFLGSVLAQDAPKAGDTAPVVSAVQDWLKSRHADRASEAFVHWNKDGVVPVDCAACHSGPGFMDFLGADESAAGVVDHPAPTGSPVDCVTCHNEKAAALDEVTFPSGEVIAGLGSSAVCAVCHQGRTSGDTVNAAVSGKDDDTIVEGLGFLNVHYRAAAATLMGGTVRGGYQYDGKTYAGRFNHVPDLNNCTNCHQPHTLKVEETSCVACHKGNDGLKAIRMSPIDADGDGNATEGVAMEIETLSEKLYAAIQNYASTVNAKPVVYDPHAYPYFFVDTNSDGQVNEGEAVFPNQYKAWTPRLLKAAYNYQFVAKDPGAYSHNPHYAMQLLYDSLESLSQKAAADMAGLVRP